MTKLKIQRIITRLNVGGPARQAIDLSRELSKKGHSCRLLSGVVPSKEGEFLEAEALETLNVDDPVSDSRFLVQPNLVREVNWREDWIAFRKIKDELERFQPDILHTHMSKAGVVGRVAALSVKRRPRLVHTFHGHVFHSYFGFWKSLMFVWLERYLSKRTDKVVAISNGQKEELDGYGIRNIQVIPLGFDLSRFLPISPFKYSGSGIRIGFVGRLVDVKNVLLFSQFALAMEKVFGYVSVHVAGSGPCSVLLDPIKHLLVFQRWVDPKDIHKFYEGVDVVVCTSKNEGTPVGLIEAMASGRLIVSTLVGGCGDLLNVSNKETSRGVFLRPDSLHTTSMYIKKVLMEGSYERIILNAKDYVSRTHNLTTLVNRIEDLYYELV